MQNGISGCFSVGYMTVRFWSCSSASNGMIIILKIALFQVCSCIAVHIGRLDGSAVAHLW